MIDAIGIHLKDLSRLPKYTWPEVREFGYRWRDSRDTSRPDTEARTALIFSVLPFAASRIRGYRCPHQFDRGDMLSLAYEGVIDAVEIFDPDRGRLTTITGWHIRKHILRWLATGGQVVRVPQHAATASPRVREYAAAVNCGVMSLGCLDPYLAEAVAIDETTPDDAAIENEESSDINRQRQRLAAMIDRLDFREQTVIRGRMCGITLHELGKTLCVTKERIRQLERRAMEKLRELV